jgi:hypothetical protein
MSFVCQAIPILDTSIFPYDDQQKNNHNSELIQRNGAGYCSITAATGAAAKGTKP